MMEDRRVKTPPRPVAPPKRKGVNQELAKSIAKQVSALMDKDELTMDDFYKASNIVAGATILLESTV